MQQLTGNGGPPDSLATHPSNAQRIEELLKHCPNAKKPPRGARCG